MCHLSHKDVHTIITHEQNIIGIKIRLDGTTHEHTIICRQLFAGHVMGSRPMKRKTEKYIERYLNLADVSSYYLFSSKYIDIVKTTTFGNKTYEKKKDWT